MRKLLTITFLLSCLALQAQKAADLFLSMPRYLFPALTYNNKADMVDFVDNGMRAEVKNVFDAQAVMTRKNDTYISVKTSAAGRMEMKVLPLNDSTSVICLVRTVCPAACLSSMRFFTTAWQELPVTDFFEMPDASAFVLSSDSAFVADSLASSSMADIDLYEFSLSPDDNTLSIKSNILDYATREEAGKLRRWLKPGGITFRWSDGRFLLEE